MPTTETIQIFNKIMNSSIFKREGEEIDVLECLISLANAVEKEPKESDEWLYLGEDGDCTCPDLIVGAYWCLTEWHAGQESKSYAAMCALGSVYSPGRSSLEKDSPEYIPYEMLSNYFESH